MYILLCPAVFVVSQLVKVVPRVEPSVVQVIKRQPGGKKQQEQRGFPEESRLNRIEGLPRGGLYV